VHATRPKCGLGIHLNFAYWPRGMYKFCIFAREDFVFCSLTLILLRMSLSLKIHLNFSVPTSTHTTFRSCRVHVLFSDNLSPFS